MRAAHRVNHIVEQRLHFVFRLARRVLGDDDIRLHQLIQFHELVGHRHMQTDAGVQTAEGGQSWRQPQRREGMRHTECQRMFFCTPHGFGCLRDIHDGQVGGIVENASGVGQGDMAPGTLKQCHIQRIFQFLDLLADGRLGDAQHFGGLGEAFIACRGDKTAQGPQGGHLRQ
jgi:hypothetical protein